MWLQQRPEAAFFIMNNFKRLTHPRASARLASSRPKRVRRASSIVSRHASLRCCAFVAQGLSNEEIGQRLFISRATVKTHVARILQKLTLRDRIQAVVIAYESGLIRPAPKTEQAGATGSM